MAGWQTVQPPPNMVPTPSVPQVKHKKTISYPLPRSLALFLNFSDPPEKGEGVTRHVNLILEAKIGTFFIVLATCITFELLS